MIRNRCLRCDGKMPWWYRFTMFVSCPACVDRVIVGRRGTDTLDMSRRIFDD